MDRAEMFRRLTQARVGHLGTVGAEGAPHVVPVCFALLGDTAYSAVDRKPKRSARLRRVANVEATGRATLLVDEYHDQDWSRLWWVRLEGPARMVADPAEMDRAVEALCAKYPQYAEEPPNGPLLALSAARLTGWSAAEAISQGVPPGPT